MELKTVAKSFGIAEIRLHQLIRHNIISFKADRRSVYVDENEVRKWLNDNPDQWRQWTENLEHTRERLIQGGYMEVYRGNL